MIPKSHLLPLGDSQLNLTTILFGKYNTETHINTQTEILF